MTKLPRIGKLTRNNIFTTIIIITIKYFVYIYIFIYIYTSYQTFMKGKCLLLHLNSKDGL